MCVRDMDLNVLHDGEGIIALNVGTERAVLDEADGEAIDLIIDTESCFMQDWQVTKGIEESWLVHAALG